MACTSVPASGSSWSPHPDFPSCWATAVSCNKSFSPQVVLGHGVYHSTTRADKSTPFLPLLCCCYCNSVVPCFPIPCQAIEHILNHRGSTDSVCKACGHPMRSHFTPAMELSHPQSIVPSPACRSFIRSCALLPSPWGRLMGSAQTLPAQPSCFPELWPFQVQPMNNESVINLASVLSPWDSAFLFIFIMLGL